MSANHEHPISSFHSLLPDSGIILDADSGLYMCLLCFGPELHEFSEEDCSVAKFVVSYRGRDVDSLRQDVLRHCGTVAHIRRVEFDRMEHHLPVTINGRRMLLDSHCVYPTLMFGAGTTLYNESMRLLLLPDVCGGIQLNPMHRYRVVRLVLREADASLPMWNRVRTRYFCQHNYHGTVPEELRGKKNVVPRIPYPSEAERYLMCFNDSVVAEGKLRKRRREDVRIQKKL